ncbi:Sodium/proline symporter [Thalassoglobus neptunius]|uniref:Sodium/proline symporter n=1 Tax=Thalassoglobus neptunius TaxID=1938619 RepID=A0A5C5X7K8_9PLAN|nr:sodium:solute symporter family protein [Thalassoglobus neptunius]TWT58768.1 Sodium/proline symporter [Thalassoglobus neptunius]
MIQLIIVCIYLGLLLCLGAFASRMFRGTSQDYMLASHSIGPFLLLMSIFGTTMTAFALVGSSGEAYKEGIGVYGQLASSSGIIHSLCFFLIGVKIYSFGKKYGYTTQIQFFRDRFESDRIGIILFPILVGLVIPYLLIGVMSAGTVVSNITEGAFTNIFASYDYGVPPWLASGVICVVVLIYVFFGGMRGTAWANAFQTLVFMALGIVTFYMISSQLGGLEAASQNVAEKHPTKLMRAVAEVEAEDYETQLAAWKKRAAYNYAVDHGILKLTPEQLSEAHESMRPGPPWQRQFLERIAESNYAYAHDLMPELTPEQMKIAEIEQNDRVVPDPIPENFLEMPMHDFPEDNWAPKAMEYFSSMIGHPKEEGKMTIKQALGRYRAMRWAPEAPRGMDQLAFLTYLFIPLSVGMFPHLFQHWLTAKSANSFKLPVVAHPIFIAIVWVPCVLVGVWATSASMPGNANVPLVPSHFNPNGVLAYMVGQLTGDVLSGFLTAGILAAIMSSLDSQFLCIGTMFTEDIAIHYGGRNRFSDKQIVLMARSFIVAIVFVTYLFSLLEVRRVFTLGVWTFSGFSSLFPLIFASLYWKRMTKMGAYACILAAFGTWVYLFKESGYGAIPDFTYFRMQPVVTMIVASTAALVGVSLVTRPPSDETLAKFFPKQKDA